MDKYLAKSYYERPEIQKAILDFAKDREIGVMFDGYFGKRPDVIEYISDVQNLVKKGVFSFHCSEERWSNALLLGDDKLSDEERAKNRVGWDLILDLDGVSFEYSKFLGKVILDYFEELNIKNVSIKFSGNKGFHIGIPFEAFSSIIGVKETRLLFPQVAKKIVLYMLHELKGRISKVLLDHEGGGMKAIENMSKKYKIPIKDLEYDKEKNEFNFMKVIDIDTILITSRHLFRMPYSLNEKSGLVSVPIAKEKLMKFERHWGEPKFVKPEYNTNHEFLKYDEKYGKDADVLLDIIESDEDYMYDKMYLEYENKLRGDSKNLIFEINEEVTLKDFPGCINYVLKGEMEDGRKRALFLLLTFLTSIKWTLETVEQVIDEWNEKLPEPLKQNYIAAQFSWFKAQSKILSPPNFSNANYYSGIGIPDEITQKDINKFGNKKAKNPLHYVYLKLKTKVKASDKK